MVRETVQVEVEGGVPFFCEVEAAVDKLDWNQMPTQFRGVFTKLPSKPGDDPEKARQLLHSARTGASSQIRLRFFDRYAYRFVMASESSLQFTAEYDSTKPWDGM